MICYDVIGDIHGQADKLEALLSHLGYTTFGRGYRAPQGRQAVFLGDLIDRGPGQIRVLNIVRTMEDSGNALCIMGNHEFNAIGFLVDDPRNPAEALRPNRSNTDKTRKNRAQHAAFLDQVGENSNEHRQWVDWFRTLPVYLDLGGIRVVHGCWDESAINTLRSIGWVPGVKLDNERMYQVGRVDKPETDLIKARKLLTCGLELDLPDGKTIVSKDGHSFDNVRIANWRDWAKEFHEIALVPKGQEAQLIGIEWPAELVISKIEGAPIFVGHHWFSGHPVIESEKLACLDWSAAASGPLVAYRWDGESELNNAKLTWVGKK